MNIPVPLPALGEAVESATISQWLKSLGDQVIEGEPLVEVSTDKVDTEIDSPATGVLIEIRSEADSAVNVGEVIAILADGENNTDTASPSDAADHTNGAGRPVPPNPGANPPVPTTLSRPAQPTEPAQPNQPVQSAVPAPSSAPQPAPSTAPPTRPSTAPSSSASSPLPAPTPAPQVKTATSETATSETTRERRPIRGGQSATSGLRGTTQTMTRLRKTIATRMLDSLQTSAQLTTIVEVDVTEVGRVRRQHNMALTSRQGVNGQGVKLSYLSFIAAAALAALRTYPQLNSRVDPEAGTITYPSAEHLGVAVDTPKGLFVPVIREAGSLRVSELAERIADVAARTREGSIQVDELSGGTFTITNTGSRGALIDTPIINQPQVAILGAGAVVRRPVVLGQEGYDESIAVRSTVYLCLTYDHRVVDGADAARYLSAIKAHLEHGSFDI